MVKEAKLLKKSGVSWKRFYELGLEYRFLAQYLRKKITKKELLDQLERSIIDYARRQMVWFNKNKAIHWVKQPRDSEKLAYSFLSSDP